MTGRLVHLAEIIEEEMAARGWGRDELTRRMVPPGSGSGERGLTRGCLDMFLAVQEPGVLLGDMAGKFARAFGVSAKFFETFHENWRASVPAPKVREGERLEIRGSFTAIGEEPEYGQWGGAVVTSQARVASPDTHFLVLTDQGRILFRAYADEGKTWQRVPEVRRG